MFKYILPLYEYSVILYTSFGNVHPFYAHGGVHTVALIHSSKV